MDVTGKTLRFGMVMDETERYLLNTIAKHERISSAAVVRRLLWREGKNLGLKLPAPLKDGCATQEDRNDK